MKYELIIQTKLFYNMFFLKGLGVVISLYFYSETASALNGCYPVHCLRIFDDLFNYDGDESCVKANELLECASQCLTDPQNTFIKALKTLKEEICSNPNKEDSRIVNKCISKQKYAISFCMYKYLEIEAEDPFTDPKLLKCRGSLDMGNCRQLSLPCTSRALYIEETLLKNFFDLFLKEDCHDIATFDVVYLELKPLLSKDNDLLAECLDKNRQLITRCFSKSDVYLKSNDNSCRSSNTFMDCVETMVQNKCKNYIGLFKNLRLSLQNRIDVNCSKNNLTQEIPQQIDVTKISSISSTNSIDKELLNQNIQEDTNLDNKDITVSTETRISKDNFHEKELKDHNESLDISAFKATIGRPGNQNIKNVSMSTVESSSNSSTNPIIIHKTTLITVSYRPKNQASSFCDFYTLIVLLCFSCCLYLDFVKR